MHDQAMPARVTKRARILAYLGKHPGQTAYEICVVLDARPEDGRHLSRSKPRRSRGRSGFDTGPLAAAPIGL